jgi:hypothetical protein
MKTVSIVVAAVVLSVGAAHGQICQTRDGGCWRFAGGKHENEARVRARAAHEGNPAGSMYEGKMSVGWTWRGSPGGRCPARAHSAGYC